MTSAGARSVCVTGLPEGGDVHMISKHGKAAMRNEEQMEQHDAAESEVPSGEKVVQPRRDGGGFRVEFQPWSGT